MKRTAIALGVGMLLLGATYFVRRFMPDNTGRNRITNMIVGDRIAGNEKITEARCKDKMGHLVAGSRPIRCPENEFYFGYVEGMFSTRICCGPKDGYTK